MNSLGTRMKWYEHRYDHALMPMVPVLARVDGRAFHTFTKGLERPYDKRLSDLMIATTKYLVEQTNARCGYTQSDEISLCWLVENLDEEIYFGGRLSKMISIIGSLATAYFNQQLPNHIPEKENQLPVFDNRVWEVPVLYEATNYFIWREVDATRNSLQMAAQSCYSHKELLGKDSAKLHDLLHDKGINWNNYPRFFRRGTYVRKRVQERAMTHDLKDLPPKHHAHKNPEMMISRTVIAEEDFPPLSKIENREGVIFYGEDPIMKSESKRENVCTQ